MTLNLYNYYGTNNVDHVFSWAPTKDQWWITGFNPEFTNGNPEKMVSIGTVDFTGREKMFEKLRIRVQKDTELNKYMIFDEDGHTVWLTWYKGVA